MTDRRRETRWTTIADRGALHAAPLPAHDRRRARRGRPRARSSPRAAATRATRRQRRRRPSPPSPPLRRHRPRRRAPHEPAAPPRSTAAARRSRCGGGASRRRSASRSGSTRRSRSSRTEANYVIDPLLMDTSQVIPQFTTAAAAGEPPDIQFVFNGIYHMENVWLGYIQPLNGLVSDDMLAAVRRDGALDLPGPAVPGRLLHRRLRPRVRQGRVRDGRPRPGQPADDVGRVPRRLRQDQEHRDHSALRRDQGRLLRRVVLRQHAHAEPRTARPTRSTSSSASSTGASRSTTSTGSSCRSCTTTASSTTTSTRSSSTRASSSPRPARRR